MQKQAELHAKEQGCSEPVYFISDKWGGYWQTSSEFGPYNFRLEDHHGKLSKVWSHQTPKEFP